MTENQIQMAASDDPGDWSPEVQFLAREVERLRAAIADTVKMDETPSKDQHIRKLEEDIKDLVSRCRRAENRAEYAEGRLRIAEADLKVLRDMSPSDHAMAREARLNHQITALTVRAEKAEAEATVLRGLWETAQAQAGSERERAEKAEKERDTAVRGRDALRDMASIRLARAEKAEAEVEMLRSTVTVWPASPSRWSHT